MNCAACSPSSSLVVGIGPGEGSYRGSWLAKSALAALPYLDDLLRGHFMLSNIMQEGTIGVGSAPVICGEGQRLRSGRRDCRLYPPTSNTDAHGWDSCAPLGYPTPGG